MPVFSVSAWLKACSRDLGLAAKIYLTFLTILRTCDSTFSVSLYSYSVFLRVVPLMMLKSSYCQSSLGNYLSTALLPSAQTPSILASNSCSESVDALPAMFLQIFLTSSFLKRVPNTSSVNLRNRLKSSLFLA